MLAEPSRNKGKSYKRGSCRECGREMPLMPDGKVRRHGVPAGTVCAGTAKYPKEARFV